MSAIATTGASAARRPARWPLVLGVLVGLAAVRAGSLETKWLVYWLLALGAAITLPFVSRAMGGVRRSLTAAFFFALPLAVGFNVVYVDAQTPSGYNGIRVTLVLLIAALYVGVRWLEGRDAFVVDAQLRRRMALFGVAGFVSAFNAEDHTLSLFGLVNLAGLMGCGLVGADMFARRESIALVRSVVILALLVQCAVLFEQHATGVVVDLTGEPIAAYGTRYPGTLGRAPSVVSQFLAIMLIFAQGAWYAARRDRRIGGVPIVACVLGTICLLLTLTRSSWIAFTLGSLVLGAYWARRGARRSGFQTAAALAILVLLSLWVLWPELAARIHSDHEADAQERWQLVLIAVEMVKAHPLIGVGINNARDRLHEFVPASFGRTDWVYVVHNQYLLVTAETGLLGLAAFLSLLATGVRAALRALRSGDREVSEAGALLLASLVIMVWGMQADFYAGTQMYLLLWVVLGMATGLATLADRTREAAR